MLRRIHVPDRGASFTEYAAVLLLVAAILIGVSTTGLHTRVAGTISYALDCVAGKADNCGGPRVTDQAGKPSPGSDPETGSTPSAPTTSGDPPTQYFDVDNDGPRRSYECGAWQRVCDWGQGAASEANDIVVDTWDGIQGTACLVHICNNEEFRGTWGGVRDSFVTTVTDPWGAAQDAYESWADGPIEDHNNAYDDRSTARTVVLGAASIFGLGLTRFLPTKPKSGTGQTHLNGTRTAANNGNLRAAERHADRAEEAAQDSERAAEANPDDYDLQEQAEQDRRAADDAAALIPVARARELLISTPNGRRINRELNELGVEIEFVDDAGGADGFYRSSDNTIRINSEFADTPWPAVVIAHEAHHATNHSSLPTVHEASREEFTTAWLRDEAEAQAAGYAFADELRAQGRRIPETPQESMYVSLYEEALERSRDDGLSNEQARARAEEEAVDGMAEYIGDAPVPGGGTYRDQFEESWDLARGD
ncbi:Flp pilus assembly pilin Flp [Lipingzhangella halophila]|uniref:Flp pilus assembly pilin Flp n=1 Tax=Lipingzhangella halophila TaxID=1783352 RepID=A0A7W7W6B1_9ACTN|nr:DUF6782 family putative metallopeptidase [Lipingzhangella halophila]MBB4934724.1 Flp pilus assembly pilin Flp [Lipingzhangella halophila]